MTIDAVLLALASIAGGIIAAVLGSVIITRFQMRRSIADAVAQAIEALREEHRADRQILHEKVSTMRDGSLREVLDRTSRIEGQLDLISRHLEMVIKAGYDREE